jgi:hypothetical protein
VLGLAIVNKLAVSLCLGESATCRQTREVEGAGVRALVLQARPMGTTQIVRWAPARMYRPKCSAMRNEEPGVEAAMQPPVTHVP